jgi:hypothetical protein
LDVVTITGAFPGLALPAIVKVAVICVPLITFTLLKLRAEFVLERVAPAMKFAPVKVTGTLLPAPPLAGLIELRSGTTEITVNVTPLLFIPPEITLTV